MSLHEKFDARDGTLGNQHLVEIVSAMILMHITFIFLPGHHLQARVSALPSPAHSRATSRIASEYVCVLFLGDQQRCQGGLNCCFAVSVFVVVFVVVSVSVLH